MAQSAPAFIGFTDTQWEALRRAELQENIRRHYPRVIMDENSKYITIIHAYVSPSDTIETYQEIKLMNQLLLNFYDMMWERRECGEWDKPEMFEMLGFESEWRDELLACDEDDDEFYDKDLAIKKEIIKQENKVIQYMNDEYPL